jgi:hypothetical protein
VVDGTIDPRSRGRNSVIGTIHGQPRPPIFGGPGTEHLSEYSGVLVELTRTRLTLSHFHLMVAGLFQLQDTVSYTYGMQNQVQ